MTTWYVRPDTSHSEIRNGTSHATAWGGWVEIVWGGAGVKAGDALYVCGVHSLSTFIQIGNHGATLNNRTVISGGYGPDPGRIVFTPGNFFLLVGRDYTTLEDLSITAGTSNSIFLFKTPGPLTGITIQRCELRGGIGQPCINLSGSNEVSHADLNILDNDFIGGSGSRLGGAISWTVAASGTPLTRLSRVTVSNNRFTGVDAARAVIQFRAEDGSNLLSNMADIVMDDNTFTACPTLAIEVFGSYVYGTCTGVRMTGNKFYDMTHNNEPFNMGGAIRVSGFAPSLTSGFGSNVIARNECYYMSGATGLLNTFYGTYRIFDNYAEDIIAPQGDGNGILIDHDSRDCVIYGNHFRRVIGHPVNENTGCGLMILDATNTVAYGNVVEGCRIGVYIGNKKTSPQFSNVYNNTFTDCTYAGVLFLSTADMTTNRIRNNIFTGPPSAPSVRVTGGPMSGESVNCYYGFSAASGHTLHASNVTVNPELDTNFRPGSTALKRAGTYLGGKDLYGKHFYDPPNIGGVDDMSATQRYLLMRP